MIEEVLLPGCWLGGGAFELIRSRPILANYYDPLTDYYSAAILSDSPYSTGETCPSPDY